MAKLKLETLVLTVTSKKFTIKLTRELIIDFLRQTHKIPDNVEITFYVPGGGDWSNMSIDIDDASPIWVRWKTDDEVTGTRI